MDLQTAYEQNAQLKRPEPLGEARYALRDRFAAIEARLERIEQALLAKAGDR